jgi:hypothetical protein
MAEDDARAESARTAESTRLATQLGSRPAEEHKITVSTAPSIGGVHRVTLAVSDVRGREVYLDWVDESDDFTRSPNGAGFALLQRPAGLPGVIGYYRYFSHPSGPYRKELVLVGFGSKGPRSVEFLVETLKPNMTGRVWLVDGHRGDGVPDVCWLTTEYTTRFKAFHWYGTGWEEVKFETRPEPDEKSAVR